MTRRASLPLLIAGFLLASVVVTAQTPPGGLGDVLALLGLSTDDLGVNTNPDWVGWVDPASVPYAPPHLETALRDPLEAIRLGGNVLAVARTAAAIEPPADRVRTVITALALQPRRPGFRGFTTTDGHRVAPGALTAVLLRLGSWPADPWSPRAVPHAGPTALPPGPHEQHLPQPLRAPVARLLQAVWSAAVTVEGSWSCVEAKVLTTAIASGDVAVRLAGGTVWWPALDEAARRGDPVARDAAWLHLAETVAETIPDLVAAAGDASVSTLHWEVPTALGRVQISGTGRDRHQCDGDCLLVIDLGGDDLWAGSAGGAVAPRHPVSVAIDVAGNDRYQQAGAPAAQGAGLGGVGLLVDIAGNDTYEALRRAQGATVLGAGLLWDLSGDDSYFADGTAQGAAVFGTGVLLDESGSDDYHIHGEGQGFGGPDGGGVLVDLAGNDHYTAVRTPSGGRADPHSNGEVAANNAQGAAVGRRGDLSDGHLWAGGVGLLVDTIGDDQYRAGNFAQGSGYWLGTGMLLEGGGDDLYESVYFSQGSASHFAVGLLLDAGGHDTHWLDREGRGFPRVRLGRRGGRSRGRCRKRQLPPRGNRPRLWRTTIHGPRARARRLRQLRSRRHRTGPRRRRRQPRRPSDGGVASLGGSHSTPERRVPRPGRRGSVRGPGSVDAHSRRQPSMGLAGSRRRMVGGQRGRRRRRRARSSRNGGTRPRCSTHERVGPPHLPIFESFAGN